MDRGGEQWQWLNSRWSRLRDVLRDAAMKHCDDPIEEIVATGDLTETSWAKFVLGMVGDFQSGRGDPGLCDAAIDLLLGDTTVMRRSVIESRRFLAADDTGRGRSLAFKRAFARLRDERIGGGSEHRGKTWGRLDRLSRDIARKHALATGQSVLRCTTSHFTDILSHLREHHAGDMKFPSKISTIKEYFLEFCDECRAQQVDVDPGEIGNLQDADAKGRYVLECLDDLSDEEQSFVRVKWRMVLPIDLNVTSYCRRTGIAESHFSKVLKRAVSKLAACIAGKLAQAESAVSAPTSQLGRY